MSSARLTLARRPIVEQRLIRLLRDCADRDVCAQDSRSAQGLPVETLQRVTRLARRAVRRGYRILEPRALFVSPDEQRLVGMLAMAQRARFNNRIEISADLRDLLFACAAGLDVAGVKLPPLSLLMVETLSDLGPVDTPLD